MKRGPDRNDENTHTIKVLPYTERHSGKCRARDYVRRNHIGADTSFISAHEAGADGMGLNRQTYRSITLSRFPSTDAIYQLGFIGAEIRTKPMANMTQHGTIPCVQQQT